MKTFNEFASKKNKPWLAIGVFGLCILTLAAAIIVVELPLNSAGVVLLAVPMAWFALCVVLDGKQDAITTELYVEYLKTCSMDLLKAASTSPEIDETSKRQIIRFLNSEHPGWSLV